MFLSGLLSSARRGGLSSYVKADGNYACICTFHGQDMVLENLLVLEQRLPAGSFVRVDRSTIVNLPRVYRLNIQQHSCIMLSPDGRELRLEITRNGIEKLMEVMG